MTKLETVGSFSDDEEEPSFKEEKGLNDELAENRVARSTGLEDGRGDKVVEGGEEMEEDKGEVDGGRGGKAEEDDEKSAVCIGKG